MLETSQSERVIDVADIDPPYPGETLEDVKRRAAFSKEDKGLLRD